MQLEKVGIEVAKDLPVGENLQDHLMSLVPYEMKITAISKKSIVYPHRLAVSLLVRIVALEDLLVFQLTQQNNKTNKELWLGAQGTLEHQRPGGDRILEKR